jgi:hypothetical protein
VKPGPADALVTICFVLYGAGARRLSRQGDHFAKFKP